MFNRPRITADAFVAALTSVSAVLAAVLEEVCPMLGVDNDAY